MAKLIGVCKDMPHYVYPDRPADWHTHMEEQEKVMDKLEKESDQAMLTGEPVGFILSFQVADGYANYRVVKAKPLQLELIPYCDSYQISAAHIRGLNLADVYVQIEQKKAFNKIFSKDVV